MSTETNHYGHNVDVTVTPFYCTDCEVDILSSIPVDAEKADREYTLTKYTTDELQAELARRGYVNGVLVHPELDEAA